jgi:hypothetical protein
MRQLQLLVSMTALLATAAAFAQVDGKPTDVHLQVQGDTTPAPYPEAYAGRPLVLDQGMMQAGLDFDLGLIAGRMAQDIGLRASFGWGVIRNLEIGADIDALKYGKDLYGAKFGGFDLYARYRFLDQLAAEFRVFAPGDGVGPRGSYIDSFGDQLLGVEVSVPFQYVILTDMLKVHATLAFDLGFVKDTYPTSNGGMPQLHLGLRYGLSYNPIRQLFIDLSSGVQARLTPSGGASFGDRVGIPLGLTVGTTLFKASTDIFLRFQFDDLKPAAGGAVDSKSIALGGRFRF